MATLALRKAGVAQRSRLLPHCLPACLIDALFCFEVIRDNEWSKSGRIWQGDKERWPKGERGLLRLSQRRQRQLSRTAHSTQHTTHTARCFRPT